MIAVCSECANRWELSKPIDSFRDGPRCSQCGSYDVETREQDSAVADLDVEARAVAALRSGAEPLDLVERGLMGIDEVGEFARKFAELAGLRLVTEADLEAIRQEARADAEERAEEAEERAEMAREAGIDALAEVVEEEEGIEVDPNQMLRAQELAYDQSHI